MLTIRWEYLSAQVVNTKVNGKSEDVTVHDFSSFLPGNGISPVPCVLLLYRYEFSMLTRLHAPEYLLLKIIITSWNIYWIQSSKTYQFSQFCFTLISTSNCSLRTPVVSTIVMNFQLWPFDQTSRLRGGSICLLKMIITSWIIYWKLNATKLTNFPNFCCTWFLAEFQNSLIFNNESKFKLYPEEFQR